MRCEHAAGEKVNEATRPPAVAMLAPASSMNYKKLRTELRQRGLDSTGNKPVLEARLEEDRAKDAGCRWKGCVGDLAAHLGKCEWEPVTCTLQGCTESILPKDLPQHKETCQHRKVPCGHCKAGVAFRSLAEHESRCQLVMIGCPNEGCSVQYQRGWINLHRNICEHEEGSCPCPGCDARLIRKDMDAHVEATHLQSAAKLVQSLWKEVATLTATSESEQRLAAASATSWVFNWRADGWGTGDFASGTHDFGFGITGIASQKRLPRFVDDTKRFFLARPLYCVRTSHGPRKSEPSSLSSFCSAPRPGRMPEACDWLPRLTLLDAGSASLTLAANPEHSNYIGWEINGRDKCMTHTTLSILDKHDAILNKVYEHGTAAAPKEVDFSNARMVGRSFTPTAEEKAQSVRADGSIRLRAEVRLFLDAA